MRKILFFACIIFTLSAISQEQKDSLIKYWGVEKVDSVKKDVLYNRARGWFNTSFNSGKEVLEIQDKENGQLSGNGSFTVYNDYSSLLVKGQVPVTIVFKINIICKNERYRYEFSNFAISQGGNKYYLTSSTEYPENINNRSLKRQADASWLHTKELVDKKMQETMNFLKEEMPKPAVVETDF